MVVSQSDPRILSQWLSLPFAITNPAVSSISPSDVDWIGHVEPQYWGQYFDYGMLLIFGGIPWQAYFQRVLSSKSASRAQILSYVAALGCVIMAIPSVLIGAVAKATGLTFWLSESIQLARLEP